LSVAIADSAVYNRVRAADTRSMLSLNDLPHV